MHRLQVYLKENNYEVQIGPNLLSHIGNQLKTMGFCGKSVIITNPALKTLYGNKLKTNLKKASLDPYMLEVPEGEEHKSLEQAGRLYYELSNIQTERMTPVLALGGGVIGDLAGFIAATYMRGVPFIQVPTTLLAQVDSSIGGKVAVNHGHLKNNIGTFYQPKLVISDISTLKTLPEKEIINGLAEVIKYGVIRDKELFKLIEDNLNGLKMMESGLMQEVVFRCAAIKAVIVEKDEKDLGLRNILNYGHTVGHALESVSGFRIKHGEGVAIGMVAAGMISNRMGILSQLELDRIISIVKETGLPSGIAGLNIEKIMQVIEYDKKKVKGKIRFILPETIGKVFINDDVSQVLVRQVLEDLNEEAQDLCDGYPK
jgi:3-dehydroquinate synthase